MSSNGEVVLVTGAGGAGVGSATARKFAAEGATIVGIDRHEGRLSGVLDKIRADFGVTTYGYALDITDRGGIENALSDLRARDARPTVLVNNAAESIQGSIFGYDPENFDRIVSVGLTAPWYLTWALLPDMREAGRGAIVNVSSVAAYNGGRGRQAPYSSAKAGLNELTRSVAIEGGPFGIRCNAVAPGFVDSPFMEANAERLAPEIERTPLRRFAKPEEIAAVISFLASEAASFITGEVVNVSGGWRLTP
jgi:3-oxoacyl-[acyl-carrier protein] reductase